MEAKQWEKIVMNQGLTTIVDWIDFFGHNVKKFAFL